MLFGLKWLVESLGLKRKIAALLQTVLTVASSIPALAPYTGALYTLAEILGITGLAHASVSGTLKKSPLSTIAAFLGTLSLAAKSIPALAPYTEIIHALTTLFSLFATGSILGSGKR